LKKIIYLFLIAICVSGVLLLNTNRACAEDTTDEDQLFSGGNTVVDSDKVVDNSTGDELKQKHIGFSGTINAKSTYSSYDSSYDWPGAGDPNQDILNQITADLWVDIRLKKGVKGFLCLGVEYYPMLSDEIKTQLGVTSLAPDHLNIGIKEFFVDANWKNKVYFRTGKQVLKWGQGYFWNPTDLINVEQKDFLNMNKIRAGTFGTKIHIPSGVKANTYFFIGMNEATETQDISLAAKYEFLVKNTEMSFSTLLQNGNPPVYGFDITGRIFNLDYRGEISLSDGANTTVLDYDTLLPGSKSGELIPRACIGFTKFFDTGDIKDRVMLTGEFYYNQAGYDQNIIQQIGSNPIAKGIYRVNYEPFMNSKYYFAVFSSISKFIVSDMTFNFNGIMNLVDNSATLSAGISYNPSMSDIGIDFNISGPIGAQYSEANISGNRLTVNLGTKIAF
jgi:hypothetical protein